MLRPTIYVPSRITKLLGPKAFGQPSGAQEPAVSTAARPPAAAAIRVGRALGLQPSRWAASQAARGQRDTHA